MNDLLERETAAEPTVEPKTETASAGEGDQGPPNLTTAAAGSNEEESDNLFQSIAEYLKNALVSK